MNQPASPGRSALFWILIAVGASCAACSALTLGVMALGLLAGDDAPVTPGRRSPPTSAAHLPTGNTPDLYPGSPGWLPSGRGVPIPDAEIVDGRPQGLWWHWQSQSLTRMNAGRVLYLPDGTRATNPRPGAGLLFDLEGQRAQRGSTGLGTFEVRGGMIIQTTDGFTHTDPFETGSDRDGPFFKNGAAKNMPLTPTSDDSLVGTWKTAGGSYVFRPDHTYESGFIALGGAYTLAAGGRGRWQLDGYLLSLQPDGAPGWITTVGATGDRFIVIGAEIYDRQ